MQEILLLQKAICQRDMQIAQLTAELAQWRLADVERQLKDLPDTENETPNK
jgi:hypothetical protein